MKRMVFGFWMLTLLLTGCGGSKPTSSGDDDIIRGPVTPTVRGTVRDTSRLGIEGAVVEARSLTGSSVIHADTTDAQGNYQLVLQGFTLGRELEIQARRVGFRDTTRIVKIESSETIGIIFDLKPAIKTAIIGTVTDPQGRAVAQAVVETVPVTATATTGADGTFRIELELTQATTYTVRVKQGNLLVESHVLVNPNQESTAKFVIQPLGKIRFVGFVRDALSGGSGLANTEMSLRDSSGLPLQTALSNTSGRYDMSVETVVGKTFVLQAVHIGFEMGLDTVIVQTDSVRVDFSLSLAVVGTVKDPRGQPVPNAIVKTVGNTVAGSVRVKNNGEYVLIVIKEATGDTLIVNADGFIEIRQWVNYSRSADNRADFQLKPVADPQPQVSPQSVTIGLLSDRDTLIIDGASTTSDLAWTVTSLPNWLFAEPVIDTVRSFETGKPLVLRVDRSRLPIGTDPQVYGSLRLSFNSSSIPTLDVVVTVARQGVAGQVISGGKPVPNAQIALSKSVQETTVLSAGLSDAEGRFALSVVPSGTYVLTAQTQNHLLSAETLTLISGQTKTQTIELISLPKPAEMVYESGVPFRILPDPGDPDRAYVLVRTNPPDNIIKVVSGLSSGRGRTSLAGSDILVGQSPTDGIFYNRHLLVTCYADTSIYMVNLDTEVKTRIKTSLGPFGLDIAGNRAYVACEGVNGLGVLEIVDLFSLKVVQTIPVGELVASSGDEPWGPYVTVVGDKVYVTNNRESGKVLVVNLSANPPQVTESINVGGRPQEILLENNTAYVYVLNKRDPSGVSVIDGLTNSRVKTISIDGQIDLLGTIAFVPKTAFNRRILLIGYHQDMVVYDLDLEIPVGKFTVTDDAAARMISVAVTADGKGILVGLERAQLGKRLVFLQF